MSSSNKQRWLIIGLLISNVVLITFLVLGHPSFQRPAPPAEIIIKRLSLDQSQVEAYRALIVEHQTQIAEIDAQIRDIRAQLYTGLNTESQANPALIAQLTALETEAEKVKLDHFRDIKALCTPEQTPKFEALTKELGDIFSHKGPKHPKGKAPR